MRLKVFAAAVVLLGYAVMSPAGNRNTYPLPEERGTAGIVAALSRAPVYARVLEITAHPDDEDAGTLTWLARKAHVRTALFSLTRGGGGQNVLGPEKYEALGLLRTGEFLEACKLYGSELYFGTEFDFGFSKTADETLAKWGRDAVLGETVRFVRMWRPTVIISKFSGTARDGHGHHQAAGVIAHEVFRLAADPNRFPEQLRGGARPWQAKKLYERAGSAQATVTVPVGHYDPVLGRSYREIGAEGYAKHRSQGMGANYALPGQAFESFRLVDSVAGAKTAENSFFDSIDTSLSAIAELAGGPGADYPFLAGSLQAAGQAAEEALRMFDPRHPEAGAGQLTRGLSILRDALLRIRGAGGPDSIRAAVEDALREKISDFEEAVSACLGVYLVARSEDVTVAPGERVKATILFFNRGSENVEVQQAVVSAPAGWPTPPNPPARSVQAGASASYDVHVTVPPGAPATEPFWYREDTQASRYKTKSVENPFLPFEPPVLTARAAYRFRGTEIPITTAVRGQRGDPLRGSDFVDLQVASGISIASRPDLSVVPFSQKEEMREVHVSVRSDQASGAKGVVRVTAPGGVQVVPPEAAFTTAHKGESVSLRFRLRFPPRFAPGKYVVEAAATVDGVEFRRGYREISHPENWTRRLYAPARTELRVVDVATAPGLTVGYISGAGDEVPQAVEQLGVQVRVLSAEDLAREDLSRFDTIVTGIRAYNVSRDLQAHNRRLLDYVQAGGTLIVQYNRPVSGGPFPYGPYPMTISGGERITVEDAPVEILDPRHPLFTQPNRISPKDFDGWVQERGLYFVVNWDRRYTPLLRGHEPGEDAKEGGLLLARYGKGYYIYTAYAWFRQLPAGVPGALRLFANMMSLGK